MIRLSFPYVQVLTVACYAIMYNVSEVILIVYLVISHQSELARYQLAAFANYHELKFSITNMMWIISKM